MADQNVFILAAREEDQKEDDKSKSKEAQQKETKESSSSSEEASNADNEKRKKSGINLINYRIFEARMEREKEYERQMSIYQQQKALYGDKEQERPRKDKQRLSRELAHGHSCVWHPWRPAYAICGYCNRPFCFEDMLEYKKEFYCLQDIDTVSLTYNIELSESGSRVSTFAGILLMFAFVSFFYFANNQMIYLLNYIAKSGVVHFFTNLNYSYGIPLAQSVIMVAGLLTAVLIFSQPRRGFYVGITLCLIAVPIFSYEYFATYTVYLGIVAAMMFIAFVSLLYARSVDVITGSGEQKYMSTTREDETRMVSWPNIGKF